MRANTGELARWREGSQSVHMHEVRSPIIQSRLRKGGGSAPFQSAVRHTIRICPSPDGWMDNLAWPGLPCQGSLQGSQPTRIGWDGMAWHGRLLSSPGSAARAPSDPSDLSDTLSPTSAGRKTGHARLVTPYQAGLQSLCVAVCAPAPLLSLAAAAVWEYIRKRRPGGSCTFLPLLSCFLLPGFSQALLSVSVACSATPIVILIKD